MVITLDNYPLKEVKEIIIQFEHCSSDIKVNIQENLIFQLQ